MSEAALSTRLMRALSLFGNPFHDLASARGHEWLAACVPVQDVLSQGILSSSTTCGRVGFSHFLALSNFSPTRGFDFAY